MIVSSASDYREAARRKLPRFLFDYIDGGANEEETLNANRADLRSIVLRQRVLKNVSELSLATEWFGQPSAFPIILGPGGCLACWAAAEKFKPPRLAAKKGIPFILSTVSICSIEEVASQARDQSGFSSMCSRIAASCGMCWNAPSRQACKISSLRSTCPVPGSRYRDARSGMSGPFAHQKRLLQAVMKPAWAFDVG